MSLKHLSEDIFRYYGLGVEMFQNFLYLKIMILMIFLRLCMIGIPIINEAKYANNYDYNKAVYLMSEFEMLENGFLMIKEDESLLLSYCHCYFMNIMILLEKLKETLNKKREQIQCVVSNGFVDDEIKFGQTQLPNLWDYADGVDTISFSLTIC